MNIEDILIYNALTHRYSHNIGAKEISHIDLTGKFFPAGQETYAATICPMYGGRVDVELFLTDSFQSIYDGGELIVKQGTTTCASKTVGASSQKFIRLDFDVKPFNTYDIYFKPKYGMYGDYFTMNAGTQVVDITTQAYVKGGDA